MRFSPDGRALITLTGDQDLRISQDHIFADLGFRRPGLREEVSFLGLLLNTIKYIFVFKSWIPHDYH